MQFYYACSRWRRTHDHCGPYEKHFYCVEAKVLIMKTETIIPAIQSLPLVEAFYTIQGEGFHQGKAAYFIRLGGCDVGCVWCDVKESWDAAKHPLRAVEDLVAEAGAQPGRIAVITGGEPLMHDCSSLTAELRRAGFATHIETSGAWPLSGQWDWICF